MTFGRRATHVKYLLLLLTGSVSLACLPGAAAVDARVRAAMAETRANGMAIAVIDDGRVAYVRRMAHETPRAIRSTLTQ